MEYKEIKQLMDDMGNSKLSSIDIEFPDGIKISMTKTTEKGLSVVTAEQTMPVTVEVPQVPAKQEKKDLEMTESFKIIKSPMVGTFYASSSPKAEPFVKVGDKVKKGQVVCIVEAMKLMNEIESEFDGEVVEICKNNEEMVEYGDVLIKLK